MSCSGALGVVVVVHLVVPTVGLLPFHARFHQIHSDPPPHRWPHVAPVQKHPASAHVRAPSAQVRGGHLRCAWPNRSTLARGKRALRRSSRDPVVWPTPTLVRLRLTRPTDDATLQHSTLHAAGWPHGSPRAPRARLIQQHGHALLGQLHGPHLKYALLRHPTVRSPQLHRSRLHQSAHGFAWPSVHSPKTARVLQAGPFPPRLAVKSPALLLRGIHDDSA